MVNRQGSGGIRAVIAAGVFLCAGCVHHPDTHRATEPDEGPAVAPPPSAQMPAESASSRGETAPVAATAQPPARASAVSPVAAAPQSPAAASPIAPVAPTAALRAFVPEEPIVKSADSKPPAARAKSPSHPAPPVHAAPAPEAAPARPAAPTLDLATLEQRLRETSAIGVFSKLSLKNQVGDLLNQFRAYHRNGKPSLEELRSDYDGLILKVLSLLQDGDPALAKAIAGSRDALWGMLTNPATFAKL